MGQQDKKSGEGPARKKKKESRFMKQQEHFDQRVKSIQQDADDSAADLFDFHDEKMRELKIRTLVLKKKNGGLTPEEENELDKLKGE